MKRTCTYCVVGLLLVMYVGVGVLGHLEVLTLLGFGSRQNAIHQAQSPYQKPTRLFWSQYRHLPSTVTVSAPSPCVVVAPALPHRLELLIGTFAMQSEVRLSSIGSPRTARAPPLS